MTHDRHSDTHAGRARADARRDVDAPGPGARAASASSGGAGQIQGRAEWTRLLLGLLVVFGLFHASATILGSDRGQHGVLVGVLIVSATAGAQRLLSLGRQGAIHGQLGLGRPLLRGVATATAIAVVLLVLAALYVRVEDVPFTLYPGWIRLLPGLFLQAGVAEEVLFRGYLFGNLRAGRTFWRAAWASMLPFVVVHLVLFALMPWPIALAATLLSFVISFPMARLFELGGRTVWAPALLHFVIQATVKVVVMAQEAQSFALFWMVASAIAPMLVFAVRLPYPVAAVSSRREPRQQQPGS